MQKSHIIVKAAILSFALFAVVWTGLKFLNGPIKSPRFIIEKQETSEGPFKADREVLAVVKELEADMQSEKTELQNEKVQRLAEILDMDLLDDPASLEEFKQLSAEDKNALRTFYRHLEREDRSGRGATVFLLGRELSNEEDLKFLDEVLKETPCLSLDNCSGLDTTLNPPESEEENPEALLGFPQIMAVRSIEAALTSSRAPLRQRLEELLQQAAENRNPYVKAAATAALQR